MKVKKYIAASMPEAMKKIRGELGEDAVILNSRVVKTGGMFGLFKKKNVEVIAAIDSVVQSAEKKQLPEKSTPQQSIESNDKMAEEIYELKKMMQQFINTKGPIDNQLPVLIEEVIKNLSAQEIKPEIMDQLVPHLLESYYVSSHLDQSEVTIKEVINWTKKWFIRKLSTIVPMEITEFPKKYISVVGPTGVGKTTTLAKIAARYVLQHNRKVAFITTDTYRISAIDQLKTYASILNIPIEVCYNKDDFKKAVEAFRSYDAVLIDTAGRNYREQKYVEDLREIFSFEGEMHTLLVLAATAKMQDMETIYKQCSAIPIDGFIFTKLDETSTYGSVVNMALTSNKGISYTTNGQNVPDDLQKASPEQIVNLMFGEMLYVNKRSS